MSRITVPAVLATLLACAPGREDGELPPPLDSATVTQARTAADQLGSDLVTMLRGELERGGPASAIAVCADSAQARTERHQASGVSIRRVGTRLRNPGNAPDSVEAAVLQAFADAIAANPPLADTALTIREAIGHFFSHSLHSIRVQEFCFV